jgi:hypothetical protein
MLSNASTALNNLIDPELLSPEETFELVKSILTSGELAEDSPLVLFSAKDEDVMISLERYYLLCR